MIDILSYLAKASFILLLFYGAYVLLMRKDTHFQFRRIYLLLGLGASILLPFIDLGFTDIGPSDTVFIFFSLFPTEQVMESSLSVQQTEWGIYEYLFLLYWIGVGAMLVRVGWISSQIIGLIQTSAFESYAKYKINFSESLQIPFSFFRYIFLPASLKGENDQTILAHELSHTRLRHSLDIVCTELYLLLFWFNPISWLLKHAIREVHEYQVDENMLNLGFNRKQYQLLLLQYSVGAKKMALAQAFNQITTKKRISMMNKKRSSRAALLKYAVILPILSIGLVFMSISPSTSILDTINKEHNMMGARYVFGHVLSAVDKTPIAGATILIEGTKIGTLTDENGKFKIEVPGDAPATLKIGFINMETHYIQIEKSIEVTVYLNQNGNKSFHSKKELANTFQFEENGDNTKIRIRKSDGKMGKPLFVVDGKIVKSGDINEFTPDNIESINVLKDKAAIEKYGKKGKNGVIEIKMKK